MKYLLAIAAISIILPGLASAQSVDLIWEANTVVPPTYSGKPLVSRESTVKVHALVFANQDNGNPWKNEQLNFLWSKDGQIIREVSGKGRDSLSYTASSKIGVNTVGVSVTDDRGRQVVQNSVKIPVVDPKVLLYEEDPVLGRYYHRAHKDLVELIKPETPFVAEPMFFSPGGLEYSWKYNGRAVSSDTGKSNSLTVLWPKGGGEGTNNLELIIKSATNVLQMISHKLTITFNAPASYDTNF